jgi:hypothetical protein
LEFWCKHHSSKPDINSNIEVLSKHLFTTANAVAVTIILFVAAGGVGVSSDDKLAQAVDRVANDANIATQTIK